MNVKRSRQGVKTKSPPAVRRPASSPASRGATLDFCSEKALPGAMNAKNPKDRYVLLKTFDG